MGAPSLHGPSPVKAWRNQVAGPQQSSQGAEEDESQTQQQHGHWALCNQLGIAGKEEEITHELALGMVAGNIDELRSHQGGMVELNWAWSPHGSREGPGLPLWHPEGHVPAYGREEKTLAVVLL